MEIRRIDNYYWVQEDGRVWSLHSEKFLNATLTQYPQVYMHRRHGPKIQQVSRLVAQAFIPNLENKPFVCHKDDNPKNNHVNNLFWGTPKENSLDMSKKGRSPRGSKSGAAKLTEKQVLEIRIKYKNGVSRTELLEEYGVDRSNIHLIVSNITWKHVKA